MATVQDISNESGFTIGKEFLIVRGPSTYAFVDALKYAYGSMQATAEFTIKYDGRQEVLPVKIVFIQHEDESGNAFIFEAYTTGSRFGRYYIKGRYDSRISKGSFTIVEGKTTKSKA